MIQITNGYPQGPSGLIVPLGSIKFQLNVDATIIAAPYGFVAADIPVVFQFNTAGQVQPNSGASAQIWSNSELNPQNSVGLGTYYLVTFYDQNGAILNATPLWWQFPQTAGSTVDISQMTAFSTVGGNVIYYPTIGTGGGTVTSVAFVGDGTILSATPSTPVTTSGQITATLLPQSANTVLAGPATGSAANPTFRVLVAADIPTGYVYSNLAAGTANLTLANTTFSTTWQNTQPITYTFANITAATSGANQSSNLIAVSGKLWTGASATDTWTLQNVIGSGTNPTTTLTFAHTAGGSGAAAVQVPVLIATGLITGQANIQLGVAGTTSGVITLEGSASGAATITAPATAGTITNAIVVSNRIQAPSLALTGLITTYNNVATAGNGVPSEPFQVKSAALTANFNAGSAQTIFTPTTPTLLRVTVQTALVVVDGASSTVPSLTLGYTDVGGIARTVTMIATSSSNVTTYYAQASNLIYTNGSTIVTVTSTGYASGTPSVMTYSLGVTVEVL